MENGQQHTAKGLDPVRILVVFVVLVIVGVAVWYGYSKIHKSAPNKTVNSASASWTEYKSEKYGFKFDYPTGWGSPSVVDDSTVKLPAQAPQIVKQTGKRYKITFPNLQSAQQPGASVTITITSTDYTSTSCNPSNQCGDSTAFTSENVKQNLKYNKQLLSHDAISTAELRYGGGTGILYIEQIVDIPKIKANAASLTYLLPQASKDCPNNKPADSEGCVTAANYNDLNKVARSIKAL